MARRGGTITPEAARLMMPGPKESVAGQILRHREQRKKKIEAARQRFESGEIPFCPQKPTARQAEFLRLTCREALFGGAAGPGKSSALLMGALQFVEVPGYAAILFRRTYKDLALPGALMDRARTWLHSSGAHWSDDEKTWTFPSGATLTFAYLENPGDELRYQGAEFQFVGFDELTQHRENQYLYMSSRLRRLQGFSVPIRLRAASNPGGPGHDWVRQRFIIEGGAEDRVFIPARLEDNPHLDQEEYLKSLAILDPITKAQLLAGDWDVRPEGRMFKRDWFRVVDTLPAGCRWVRYWDLAATKPKEETDPDWSVGTLVGLSNRGEYFVADMKRLRDTPGTVERAVEEIAHEDTPAVAVWIEQEPGSSGLAVVSHYQRNVLQGYAVRGYRVTGTKEARAMVVAAQAEAGHVCLLRGEWNSAFLDEHMAFPTKGVHDDIVDSNSGAFQVLTSRGRPVFEEFNERIHVAEEVLGYDPGRSLYLGVTLRQDYVCVPVQLAGAGQVMVFPALEIDTEQTVGPSEFARSILTHLAEVYAGPADCEASKLDLFFVGDPEVGMSTPATEPMRSAFREMRKAEALLFAHAPHGDDRERIEGVRSRLAAILSGGKPALLVDPRAYSVIHALAGEYYYPRGSDGQIDYLPAENHAACVARALECAVSRLVRSRLRDDEATEVSAREVRSRASGWRRG